MDDKRLQLLETRTMRGDDGQRYVVRGYEHLALLRVGVTEQWESTGLIEYKLDDGEHVNVDGKGVMTIARTGVRLAAETAERART